MTRPQYDEDHAGGMIKSVLSKGSFQSGLDSRRKGSRRASLHAGHTAYLWGFTMNELYRVRSVHLAKSGDAVNRFDHVRALMTPELARRVGVVRANSAPSTRPRGSTCQSSRSSWNSQRSRIATLPFNYVDYFQSNENLSNVTVGRVGGAYAFIGPRWKGALPDKIQRVNVASDTVWIIGRTEVKGPDDVKNVNALQDATTSRRCVNGWSVDATPLAKTYIRSGLPTT